MAKKITGFVKLQIPAGQANPSPPVGPALGQHGVNIMEFCKAFNAECQKQGFQTGTPTPVVITVYVDKTISFVLKTPPASYLILKALGLKKGSSVPNKTKVGTIKRVQLEEIAVAKKTDLTAANMDAAVRTIAGTARSMGVLVEGVE